MTYYIRLLTLSHVLCCLSRRFRMLQSGSLEFSSVRLTDTGNYTCLATNEAGSANKSLAFEVRMCYYEHVQELGEFFDVN